MPTGKMILAFALVGLSGCGGWAHTTSEGTPALLANCSPEYDSYDPESDISKLHDSCMKDASRRLDQNVGLDEDALYKVCEDFVEENQRLVGCEAPEPNCFGGFCFTGNARVTAVYAFSCPESGCSMLAPTEWSVPDDPSGKVVPMSGGAIK
jgi:hypothetical protein